MLRELSLPPHYDSKRAGDILYQPAEALIFSDEPRQWAKRFGVQPAAADKTRIHVLAIDQQISFCMKEGSLYVGGLSGDGAIQDSQRFAEWMYRNAGRITETTFTFDTHHIYQIFFTTFWLQEDGTHPSPFQFVTTADIKKGRLRPDPAIAWWLASGNYAWLQNQARFYCEELERQGKYQLYLWPPHTLLGSPGHALVGILQEARYFHAAMRGNKANAAVKGSNPLTENYSVFKPEVTKRYDGRGVIEQISTDVLRTVMEYDVVVVAGQAGSHCVKSSIDDILDFVAAQDPKLAGKIYVLRDCTSSVVVRDPAGNVVVDFTPNMEGAFKEYQDAGMHLVESTTPMENWPDIKLAA